MRRALVFVAGLLAVLAAATAGPSGAATHAVRIAQIDTSRYPLITAVVIAPGSDKLRQVPFTLQESGKDVTATQTGGGAPAAIGVAIDVSRSMAGPPLAAAKKAAASFVNAKRKADSMSIYSFGHEANPVHGLDTDINALGSSMNQVTLDTEQGTALYDSVIQASSELGTAPTLTKVLVVLTDGDDTTHTKLAAAVKAAKAGSVAIDAIAIGSGDHAALKSLARQTGGHVFAAGD